MNTDRYVFTQVLSLINNYAFQKCLQRYNGNYRSRGLNCWNKFARLFFGQLTARNGLRDSCLCLNAHKSSLYHLEIKQNLQIKTLRSHSENAVKTYLWIAISIYRKANQSKCQKTT